MTNEAREWKVLWRRPSPGRSCCRSSPPRARAEYARRHPHRRTARRHGHPRLRCGHGGGFGLVLVDCAACQSRIRDSRQHRILQHPGRRAVARFEARAGQIFHQRPVLWAGRSGFCPAVRADGIDGCPGPPGAARQQRLFTNAWPRRIPGSTPASTTTCSTCSASEAGCLIRSCTAKYLPAGDPGTFFRYGFIRADECVCWNRVWSFSRTMTCT